MDGSTSPCTSASHIAGSCGLCASSELVQLTFPKQISKSTPKAKLIRQPYIPPFFTTLSRIVYSWILLARLSMRKGIVNGIFHRSVGEGFGFGVQDPRLVWGLIRVEGRGLGAEGSSKALT